MSQAFAAKEFKQASGSTPAGKQETPPIQWDFGWDDTKKMMWRCQQGKPHTTTWQQGCEFKEDGESIQVIAVFEDGYREVCPWITKEEYDNLSAGGKPQQARRVSKLVNKKSKDVWTGALKDTQIKLTVLYPKDRPHIVVMYGRGSHTLPGIFCVPVVPMVPVALVARGASPQGASPLTL